MSTDHVPHVARYRFVERLGAGGLGVVMAADDPELGRRVAIKLIRVGARDRSAFERLEREATALAKVSHPHVVSVFDVGRYDVRDDDADDTGWPPDVPLVGVYIVMERCEGHDLATWLRTPRVPAQVLRVFTAAGRGLAAAHAAGVVHRDFKPANVMVSEGSVKVLDFGLAQWVQGVEPSTLQDGVEDGGPIEPSASMTMTGAVMGTPAYMAPEQHAGKRVDERSDQYAFCVALCEALCGARPFAGETVVDLHRAKLKLSFHPRVHEISPRLRAVIERGLACDPDERWPSMTELLGALEEPRSYAAWWGVGVLASLVGVAGWAALHDAASPEVSVQPPVEVARVVAVDGYPPSPAAHALRVAAEVAVMGREPNEALRAILDEVAPEGTLPDDDPSLEAEVLLWRGRLTDDASSADLYRRAFFLAREADVPSTAARAAIAMTTVVMGDHGQALAEWGRHAWVEVERGPEDRSAAIEVAVTAAYGRAIAITDEEATAGLELATAVVGDVEPEDGVFVAHYLLQLSAGWRAMDEPEAALGWAQRAATLLDGVAELDHPLRWRAAEEMGRALYWMERCDEAMPYYDQALAGYRSQGEEAVEEEAMARDLVATCLRKLGRLDASIVEHRRALEYWEAERPEVSVPQLHAHLQIARMLVELGRNAEAEVEYERTLKVVDPTAPDHWMRKEAREELAELRGE